MSKRAEEAIAAFHNQALLDAQKYAQLRGGDILQEITYGRGLKTGFIRGYEQAEKDITLTWEDVAILIAIYEHEVEAGNISRYEDKGTPSLHEASEIILQRFNEIKKR